MRFDIISLFPEFVAQIAAHGVVGRAGERGLLSIHGWNPRDHAEGSYRRVDDRPFGGGPGMVMLIDPLRAAIQAAREADEAPAKVFYLTPQGSRLTQVKVRELAAQPRLILLCGRCRVTTLASHVGGGCSRWAGPGCGGRTCWTRLPCRSRTGPCCRPSAIAMPKRSKIPARTPKTLALQGKFPL